MPRDKSIKKVLLIGSGPIVIGQAAEFDYAGAQACRVLREEGVEVVLVNSNPATIMTDRVMADKIYLEPLTETTLKRIIIKEKPDGLLATLGGQTALNLAMKLFKSGFLASKNVRLIGTDTDAIDKAEDRSLFRDEMKRIGQPVIPSEIANDVETSLRIAEEIGYPVIIRPAFTLGGSGGGVANDPDELRQAARTGLDASPIRQILVERYIYGWKEIEFETLRDADGNAIAVCSMENVDPVGVHTGDSIVVAPALTLSDKEFQMLRSAAIDIVSSLGIVGGCNCQFALDPDSFRYAVIEVNPRVSRSSALASKATGYPIAKISTRIALGYRLNEIKNEVTGKTCACFEPALDYVVVKLPKWSFEKFEGASRRLGTQMKATGEVMSISTSFESAMMKAVRGAELKTETLNLPYQRSEDIIPRLRSADDRRIFTVFEALKKGVSPDEIFEITKIDRFFLYKLRNLADFENRIAGKQPDENDYSEAKRLGYTDRALEEISGHGVAGLHRDAVYRIVDTCAAEFSAETPYFYSTYDERCESRSFRKSGRPVIIVLGSGPIRIGQGIEFDYSSVHCVMTLRSLGYDVVIINNNPETVSTDYDTADRLYFEPLTPEDVMNVIKAENPVGVVVAFGGQTSIKLTKYLSENGVRILGTSASGIDLAEDRERFDELLEKYGIKRPVGTSVLTEEEALSAAERIGYPVLLRPSYVIGGQNMSIIHNAEEAHHYMRRILETGIENPVLVDKYMMGIELEVDVISDGRDVLIPGIMEHIERAGVHSGDSIAVYPPYNINDGMIDRVVKCSETLALSLGTQGLVNIQYLIYENELYVIEVNPRASRTVPYISKVTGVPMVDIASRVMLGQSLASLGYKSGLYGTPPYYAVKVPVFSFEKLTDANAYLGPEMKSTGEVLGVGKTLREALFKGLKSAGFDVGRSNRSGTPGVLISVEHRDMQEAVALAKKYDDLGFAIYATSETAGEIRSLGTDVITTPDVDDREKLFSLLESGAINYIVYTGAVYDSTERDYIALHRKALTLGILCMTSLDTANALADTIAGRFNENNTELVDINNMRREKTVIGFTKMQGTGDDYIFIDNRDGAIDCPESLCPTLCDRHYGVGAYGIVLIENSDVADCSMRVFNRDGSEGFMAGNAVRCVGKYLFDNGIVTSPDVTVETASGVRKLHMIIRNSAVTYVSVEMGAPVLLPASIPCTLGGDSVVARPYTVNGTEYEITCLSVGNPHCVVFCDRTDAIDVRRVGPYFENADIFPERVNTEFVHVVNRNTLKMRAYERGNGETAACGTGACAAAYAAILNGFCRFGTDIVVKTRGGDLTVNCRPDGIILSGNAETVFRGFFEY